MKRIHVVIIIIISIIKETKETVTVMEERALFYRDEKNDPIYDLVPDLSQAQPLVRNSPVKKLDAIRDFRNEIDQEVSINEASPPPMGQAS